MSEEDTTNLHWPRLYKVTEDKVWEFSHLIFEEDQALVLLYWALGWDGMSQACGIRGPNQMGYLDYLE